MAAQTPLSLASLALGGLGWTATEYLLHRFVGHGPKRKRPASIAARLTPAGLAAEFNAEHLAHHTDPQYFAPSSHKVVAACVAIPVLATALSPLAGVRRAASFALGFGLTYGAYEVVHRRIHTEGPTGPYSRWARRHHLLHHHKTPRSNHGVTSALWDLVARTELPAERVRVPRHVAAPWMLDPAGELRPELANDYELVGKKARASETSEPAA